MRNSPWDHPSAISVIERPCSVAALRADEKVSSLTARSVLRPVPTRSCEEENANPPTSRPASQGSKALQGCAYRLSECVGQIGTIVAGVVQDMLAVHREDNDSRQQVQLQMMLAHREETELRVHEVQKSADVRLLETRESADKQMHLLREMHEIAARCRELETEKSVRREVEKHQTNLAWVNSGRAEHERQRSVVQRELESQRPGSVARVGFAESPPSTRASTPSLPQAFVCDSERDNYAAVVDSRIVSCARPHVPKSIARLRRAPIRFSNHGWVAPAVNRKRPTPCSYPWCRPGRIALP